MKYVTGHREILSGTTDQNGIFRHSWTISGNAKVGTFVVHVDVTADGNKSGSKEKSFQVIAKGLTPGATSNLNRTLNQTDPTGRYECNEDGLSYGSYFDKNGLIVGSPCDPVEFCSDKGSTDPVVIDYCQDIWTDVDDCLDGQGNERYPGCSSEPLPPTPPNNTKPPVPLPPNCNVPNPPPECEVPPPECPPSTTGIPPDCEPIPPNCNVEDPPPECEEPIVCDDGSTVPPGGECPEPPIECPDGSTVAPGEECPEEEIAEEDEQENNNDSDPEPEPEPEPNDSEEE